ncbi:MAG: YbhB/YbcL family Raf kinase inhibitor-like protein [Phycisphaeraceae bacterium]
MRITSGAFTDGSPIPKRYTEDGNNVSPPLQWQDVPAGAEQLALIVEDPDAPRQDPFVHWLVYNIPASATGLPEAAPRDETLPQPQGATQGRNSFPKNSLGYRGPAPPKGHGMHHYRFRLFALEQPVNLGPGISKDALVHAMQGHILAESELVGTYERS